MFTERRARYARLVLRGELDLGVVGDFEQRVRELTYENPPEELEIDLRGLDYIDSAGLGAMLRADKIAQREGFRLVIVRGSRDVHNAFVISGLADSLDMVDRPSDIE